MNERINYERKQKNSKILVPIKLLGHKVSRIIFHQQSSVHIFTPVNDDIRELNNHTRRLLNLYTNGQSNVY